MGRLAESWAHYLHILDTLETAQAFGLAVGPEGPVKLRLRSHEEMLSDWGRLTFALNNINRSMGLCDLYPFVLSEPAQRKLGFIHELLNEVWQQNCNIGNEAFTSQSSSTS